MILVLLLCKLILQAAVLYFKGGKTEIKESCLIFAMIHGTLSSQVLMSYINS